MAVALFATLALLAGIFSPPGIASSADGDAVSSKDDRRVIGGLFNERYCEIFAISAPTEAGFPVRIYNTIGLNSCPGSTWRITRFRRDSR